MVSISADIATPGGNVVGEVALFLNGSFAGTWLAASVAASGGVMVTCGNSYIAACNANASNTFAVKVETQNATSTATVNFYNFNLTVQPL